jgi:DNA polymerase elongation subunit (family B)
MTEEQQQITKKGKRLPIDYDFSQSKNFEYFSIGWESTDYNHDFDDEDKYKKQLNRPHNKEYTIFNFGITEEGYSVCNRIINNKPYFYILIPEEFNEKQVKALEYALNPYNSVEYEDEDLEDYTSITQKQKFFSIYYKSAITFYETKNKPKTVEREIFWRFMNHKKFKFIKIYFNSVSAMKFYYRALSSKIDLDIPGYKHGYKFKLFEADFEPMLRLYHDLNIKPTNWLGVKSSAINKTKKQSSCQINISIDWKNIKFIEKDSIAPIRVLSFDIEADSSHGDFPVAIKDCKKLAIQLVNAWQTNIKTLKKITDKTSDKYKSAEYKINREKNFIRDCLYKALQLDKYKVSICKEGALDYLNDEVLDKIYLKDVYNIESKLKSYRFQCLYRDIFHICDNPIIKITANRELKAAVKYLEASVAKWEKDNEQEIDYKNYLLLIDKVYKKLELDDYTQFKNKVINLELMVKLVNTQLNQFFGFAEGDRVIQIGSVLWEYGDEKPFHNNILTLDGCDDFKVDKDDCEVERFLYNKYDKTNTSINEAEKKLLMRWSELVRDYDPDIITGYNIHGFDMLFMYDRAKDLMTKKGSKTLTRSDLIKLRKNAKFQSFLLMGRIHKKLAQKCDDFEGRLINKKLSSSALGDNYLFFFNTPGRVQIDLLKVCQSSMDKLPSYKLDDVASYYIGGEIKKVLDVKGDESNEKSNRIEIQKINEIDDGNFITITMSKTGQQLYDGKKIAVNKIERDNNIIEIELPIEKNCLGNVPKWGLAKDDVSPKELFALQRGNDTDRMKIAKYCIQDCMLLIRLMRKIECIPNNIGMSNVCLIPLAYIFQRGQGIKVFSLIVDECAKSGFLLPTLEKVQIEEDEEELDENQVAKIRKELYTYESNYRNKEYKNKNQNDIQDISNEHEKVFQLQSDFNVIKMTDDSYEGAIVLPPKPGIYFEPVVVLDFSSLYPSEMIASNLSHDSFVTNPIWLGDEGKKRLEDLGYEVMDRDYDNYKWIDPNIKSKGKVKDGISTVRFVQPNDGSKGLIPRVLQKLLGARKATKNRMKSEKDPFKKSLLEGLQLAYKLTANSVYGQIGARTSKIYTEQIAAATTAGGRENIYKARDYCLKNNKGCDVVYGDSIPGYEYISIYSKDNIKLNNDKDNFCIDSVQISEFVEYDCDKFLDKNGKTYYKPKEQNCFYTPTEDGPTKIISVMEHYSKHHIYKISTKQSSVCVTSDHSMILADGTPIKPTELKLGDKILTIDDSLDNGIIIKMEDLGPYEGPVYDLTTENHHFNAGEGDIVVHNTDSVFVKINLDYRLPPTYDRALELFDLYKKDVHFAPIERVEGKNMPETKLEKLKRSVEISLWLQESLKKDKIFKPPHDLEYEKVYWPLVLITKKRYIGIKYEFNPEKGSKTSMGVVSKRRDNAPLLKHSFIGVVDTIMKDCDVLKAINFVKGVCMDMINDKFDLNMFVISKTLRDFYKDPESIAHKVLADRIGERDPGNKPASNERIPYCYIKIKEEPGIKYTQGDRIEHINFIRENNCQIDYEVYITNQLMKPISQIFELALEDIPGYPYKNHPNHIKDVENNFYNKHKGDLKKTAKAVSTYRQNLVHKLIFEPLVHIAVNKMNKVNTVDNYFKFIKPNNSNNDKCNNDKHNNNTENKIDILDNNDNNNDIINEQNENIKEKKISKLYCKKTNQITLDNIGFKNVDKTKEKLRKKLIDAQKEKNKKEVTKANKNKKQVFISSFFQKPEDK